MERELLVNGKAFLKGYCDSQHLQSHGKTQTVLWIQGGVWTEPRTRQENQSFFHRHFSMEGFVFEHSVFMKCKYRDEISCLIFQKDVIPGKKKNVLESLCRFRDKAT